MAAPPQQRELRYNVTLVTDPRQAVQGMQAVGQSVDAVGKKATAAQVELSRLAQAQGMTAAGPMPGSGGTSGGGGFGGAAVGKLFAAAAAVQVVGNLTDAIGKLGDSTTGVREKVLNLTDAVPIIGDAITSILRTSFDLIERIKTDMDGGLGTYDAKRARIAAAPFDAARNASAFQRYSQGMNEGFADESALFPAMANRRYIDQVNALRFGAAGLSGSDKAFDESRRAAETNVLGARGQRDVAFTRARSTDAALEEQRLRQNAAFGRSNAAVRSALDAASGAGVTDEKDLVDKLTQADKARAEAAREQLKYEELLKKQKADALALAQAESALRKANVGLAQTELQIVNQKISANKSAASQFGDFDPAKQQAVLRAAERAKTDGYNELSPEQKQLLRSTAATAEFADGLAQKAGDTPLLSELFKTVGREDTKTLQGRQQELQATVNLGFTVDATKLEADVVNAIAGPIGKALMQAFDNALRLRDQEIALRQAGQKVSKK